MKNLFPPLLLLLFFAMGMALNISCSDDNLEDQNFENLNLIAQGDCITGSVEGLVMEFCLFDIDGNSQTTFEENENFIFSLHFENKSQETIVIGENLFDTEFFNVKDLNENKDWDQPYTSVWCQYSLAPREIRIEPGKSFTLNCPWVLENGLSATSPLCKSESNELLPKGDYSTGFNTDFSIKIGERIVQLDEKSEISLQFSVK